jgi:hypothetical protein
VPLTNILDQLETGHDPDRHVRGTYNCNCSEKKQSNRKKTLPDILLYLEQYVFWPFMFIFFVQLE